MVASTAEGYNPPPEFQEDTKDSLFKPDLTDSKELWLIQWPVNQLPDFDGQELAVEFRPDGRLGSFKSSSGKEYFINSAGQEPDATVFLSGTESKIAGKISRRITLVHYPEPDEPKKPDLRQMYQRSSGVSVTNSHFTTPSQSFRSRNSISRSGLRMSTHSSKQKSAISDVGEPSKKSLKRRLVDEPTMSMGQHTQDSGPTHSAVTSSGSFQRSRPGKSSKRIEKEI